MKDAKKRGSIGTRLRLGGGAVGSAGGDAGGSAGRGAGAVAMLAGLAMLAAVQPGCSCSDESTQDTTTTSTTTSATSSGGGMGGAGGSGGSGNVGGSGDVGGAGGGVGGSGGAGGSGGGASGDFQITPAASVRAFDVTPSPTGDRLYVAGFGADGSAAIWTVTLAGGDVATLVTGSGLVAPFGITIDHTGLNLYVADPAAGEAGGVDAGRIFRVGTGGTVTALSVGEGTRPRGVAYHEGTGGEGRLLFTGVDPVDGRPTLYDAPLSGGSAAVLHAGQPLVDPSGVTIASDGKVYVCDTRGAGDQSAAVFVIEQGVANVVATGLSVGMPCGVALSRNGQALLVSARDRLTGTGAVQVITLADGSTTTLTDQIGAYREPAGLHRARNADVFGFADSTAEGSGRVFVISQGP